MPPAPPEPGSSASAAEPLACVTCRSRKLKCDRLKPVCTRCQRVDAECVYPESRRKPAFKRRNVRELEERLAQVEGMLRDSKSDDKTSPSSGTPDPSSSSAGAAGPSQDVGSSANFPFGNSDWNIDLESLMNPLSGENDQASPVGQVPMSVPMVDQDNLPNPYTSSTRELIGLGMFESLPPFEVMEDLNNFFFQHQAPFIPIIQPARYLQSFYSAPHKKPPMCLQYAIWTMASNGHPKYGSYHDVFYKRARHYADSDEMRGYGEYFITVQHAQAWELIATDEARNMYFTRAAMSGAKAIRLVHMMGLHRLDGPREEVVPVLSPPSSWVELEERRRTFWGAFCIDSHASISTGWPNLIDTKEVTTLLPCSEECFNQDKEEKTSSLEDAFKGASYSTFAGGVVICHLFNQILKHVHRGKPSDRPEDVEYGLFWTRHRDLDNTLSSAFMFLPERFRLPANLRDPTAVHTNLNLHASVICLHHAAVDKVDVHDLAPPLKASSLTRLKTAAEEIINIFKLTSHLTASYRSPLVALSMYCAASVYIYHAKDSPTQGLSPTDHQNLEFIINAMEAIGRQHLITRAFLQQVCLDVEANGVAPAIRMPRLSLYKNMFGMCRSNIPLLVRSSVSRHTEPQSPLPGRLPLGNPTPGRLGDPASMASTAAAPGFGGKAGLTKFDFPTIVDDLSPPEVTDDNSGSSPDKDADRGGDASTRNKRKRMVSPVPDPPPSSSSPTSTAASKYPGGLFSSFAATTARLSDEPLLGRSVFSSPLVGGSLCGTGAAVNLPLHYPPPHRAGSGRTTSSSQRSPPEEAAETEKEKGGSSGSGSTPAVETTAAGARSGSRQGTLVEELLAEFGNSEHWDVMNGLLVDEGEVEDVMIFPHG